MEFEQFFQAYMVCALWSSTDDEGNPFDDVYEINDFAEYAVDSMRSDCLEFYNAHHHIMRDANPDFARHGHDFWLTRNGHGAGFFDRGYGERGDALSKAAKAYGEVYLYADAYGKVWI